MHTGARARKQKYISFYIYLYMKTFLKTGIYIYIYIYILLIITGVQASGVIIDRLLRQCCFVWSEIVGPHSKKKKKCQRSVSWARSTLRSLLRCSRLYLCVFMYALVYSSLIFIVSHIFLFIFIVLGKLIKKIK